MNTLYPIGTRVKHSGHGFGTIVGLNGISKNLYVEQNLGSPEVTTVVVAGLGEAVVGSFYSSDRFPYVVHFDQSARFPNGYKDVYDVDGIVMVLA